MADRSVRRPLAVMAAGLVWLMATAQAAPPPADDPELLRRASDILARAPLIDTHNDLPYMVLDAAGGDLNAVPVARGAPDFSADIPRLRAGRVGAQYWSIYTAASARHDGSALRDALRAVDITRELIRTNPELELVGTADEIEAAHRRGKIGSLMGLEGGHMLDGSIGVLRAFHALGVRYITLTHNDSLSWADAATDRPRNNGLTEFGEQVVREANRVGMFVDLSHVSRDTMLDALRVSRAPVIFSHSNATAVSPAARNVPDEVLRLLPANGGVVHITFIWFFSTARHVAWDQERAAAIEAIRRDNDDEAKVRAAIADWEKRNPHPPATVADVADHIDHVRRVAGIDHVGIGADFYDNGATSMAEGLKDVTTYPRLFAELLRRGYSEADLMKIAGRNHLRAMRRMEAVSRELQRTEPARYDIVPARD